MHAIRIDRGKPLAAEPHLGHNRYHPDIAPNFDRFLSRNFTVDNSQPGIDDGPCEHPSCVDPNDEDDDGHGTHVASTIGSPLNGIGIGGVAPKVDIVNIRSGQDTGFFFLQPTVDALTYAGNPANLADLAGDPRYVFAHGDIGDTGLVARLLSGRREAVTA